MTSTINVNFEPVWKLTGECNQCGDCCRDIVIYDGNKFIRTEEDFTKLVEENDYYRMFEISSQQPTILYFTCSNLSGDNTCMIHAKRPQVCRDYPDINMFKDGSELPANCSYKLVEV